MTTNNETKSLKAGLIEKFNIVNAERIRSEVLTKNLTTHETEERFAAFFGRKPDRADGMRAYFEDVTVQRNCGYQGGWQVVQLCPNPKCNSEVVSSAFSKLEDIGKQLASKPVHYGCLKSIPVVKSTDEQLLEILTQFVSENSSCNCD